jgi:hypothetical protein
MSPLAPLWITPEIHRGQLGDSVIHRHGDSNGDSTRNPCNINGDSYRDSSGQLSAARRDRSPSLRGDSPGGTGQQAPPRSTHQPTEPSPNTGATR